MIPQGYEITGDMVPRVRNILGVPDRRDTGTNSLLTSNIALARCIIQHAISIHGPRKKSMIRTERVSAVHRI